MASSHVMREDVSIGETGKKCCGFFFRLNTVQSSGSPHEDATSPQFNRLSPLPGLSKQPEKSSWGRNQEFAKGIRGSGEESPPTRSR